MAIPAGGHSLWAPDQGVPTPELDQPRIRLDAIVGVAAEQHDQLLLRLHPQLAIDGMEVVADGPSREP